jgi:hypothetical protein
MNEYRVYTKGGHRFMWFGESCADVTRQVELCGHAVVRVEFVRAHDLPSGKTAELRPDRR